MSRFKRNLDKYCIAVGAAFKEAEKTFSERIVDEFLPKWRLKTPGFLLRHGVVATEDALLYEMRSLVQEIASQAISLAPPHVRVIYKSISPESVAEPTFLNPLLEVMRRRRVPLTVIDSLFSSVDAAPLTSGFQQLL